MLDDDNLEWIGFYLDLYQQTYGDNVDDKKLSQYMIEINLLSKNDRFLEHSSRYG